ncbi:hypothetical protein PSHT_10587 [Puccinia striiformis]|uniref:Uncharacterized protein n=1 Tax=Puccinia striiformis TaxID=27350 RepID=A0A2S4V8M6_9BASI|nr:hypothetical protein PSHT_10587 [Puccinia striiformis]
MARVTPEAPSALRQSRKPTRKPKTPSPSHSPTPPPSPPPRSEHPSEEEIASDHDDDLGINFSEDDPKAQDEHLPAIDPLIDSMDQEFRQQNPGYQFDQDTPDRSMEDPDHPCCIVPTSELAKLRAMMNLDDEHYEQALQILSMPGGPISFLVMKELERHQEKSNDRGESSDLPSDTNSNSRTRARRSRKSSDYSKALKERIRDCSKEAFLQTNVEVYTRGKYGPGMTDMSLLTITMQKLHAQPADFRSKHFPPCLNSNARVRRSFLTLVRDIRPPSCSIREKLLKGVLNSKGDIPWTLYKAHWNFEKKKQKKITILLTGRIAHIRLQTVDHLLHPPLQKKISQWTLIDQKLKELKAHGSDYRMAFSKAVIIRDNELFGTGTALADIAEHRIILPSDKEVQAQLPLITSSQHQTNPSA